MSVRSLATRLFNARTNVPWVLAMVTGAGIGGSQDMMVRGLALGFALGLVWALLFGKQPGAADRSSEA
ncbi:MAG: hypothetical protein ACFE0P_16015 [Oceanicaulis sp.]